MIDMMRLAVCAPLLTTLAWLDAWQQVLTPPAPAAPRTGVIVLTRPDGTRLVLHPTP